MKDTSWERVIHEDWPSETLVSKKRSETNVRNSFLVTSTPLPIEAKKGHQRSQSMYSIHQMESLIPPLTKVRTNGETESPLLPGFFSYENDQTTSQFQAAYSSAISSEDYIYAEKLLNQQLSKILDIAEKGKLLRLAAETNKKFSKYQNALEVLELATQIDPQNITFSLESAKLLNEIGSYDEEDDLLFEALKRTSFNSVLLSKMLKSLERRSLIAKARAVLGLAVKQSTNCALFEGALFEIRHGPADLALELINSCCEISREWRGSAFLEIVEMCSRRGLSEAVLKYSEYGFREVPSLFALCGYSLRFQPTTDNAINVYELSCEASSMARSRLAPILGHVLASKGLYDQCKSVMCFSMCCAQSEQKSRLFYNATLLSIFFKDFELVQLLINKGRSITQRKSQLPFYLLRAKFLEICNSNQASQNFIELYNAFNDDWHAHFEYSLYLSRQGKRNEARRIVVNALASLPENGRLLSLKVQLLDGENQVQGFVEAIQSAPKSGEVWLEGARIVLNPLSPYFNLKEARYFLNTAHLFTPQYLDIFIEMVRLEMLENGLYCDLSLIEDKFINSEGNQGTVFHSFRVVGNEFGREEFDSMVNCVRNDLILNSKIYNRAIARSSFVIHSLKSEIEKLEKDSKGRSTLFSNGISTFGKKGNVMDILGVSAAFI